MWKTDLSPPGEEGDGGEGTHTYEYLYSEESPDNFEQENANYVVSGNTLDKL